MAACTPATESTCRARVALPQATPSLLRVGMQFAKTTSWPGVPPAAEGGAHLPWGCGLGALLITLSYLANMCEVTG